jgi:molybdate transport system substrate-binding protein
MVYRSDVTSSAARYVSVVEIPEGANIVAVYPIAPLKNGGESEAARAFVDLVLSSEGQTILERRGLIPVGATPSP